MLSDKYLMSYVSSSTLERVCGDVKCRNTHHAARLIRTILSGVYAQRCRQRIRIE